MVLAGGPDRERPVSLQSGAAVAYALREAGHDVRECDIGPDDLSALKAFEKWGGDVLFPVLHGRWGEGGGLQLLLDKRGLTYFGSRARAASLCMDKSRAKKRFLDAGLPTPNWELLDSTQVPPMHLPIVIKPNDEGSSIDVAICHNPTQVKQAWRELGRRNPQLLVETFIGGKELTVGVVDRLDAEGGGTFALPPLQIVPAASFYDYEAKYHRADTQYLFDIDLPESLLVEVQRLATAAHEHAGVSHLCRVDMIVDADQRIWILEVNTLPGFTTHSNVPLAADHMGEPMHVFVDRLVHLALESSARLNLAANAEP